MICEVVILDWVRLSVERVFRALLSRLWIKGDLNLDDKELKKCLQW